MCGITGCFFKGHEFFAKNAAKIMKHRGIDGCSILSKKDYSVAHLLHSIVGFVKQPIILKNSLLIANCEIYNYEKLAEKFKLNVLNDADLMIKLIDKIGLIKALDEFDGVYAACYINKNKAYLFRDKIGEKPLWFSPKKFCFASEKKALDAQGIKCAVELNPRNVLTYDLKTKKIILKYLGFIETKKVKSNDWAESVSNALIESVKKMIPENAKIGVLFSGGIDSTIVATILKKLGKDFVCYSSGLKKSADVLFAIKTAKNHGFKLKVSEFSEESVKKDLPKICEIIESSNAVKAGVSIPFFYACKAAQKDGVKVIFSGLGSEEIFAGYKRFEGSSSIADESIHGLKQLYERDLYRDDCLTMHHCMELRLPFLDYELINLALSIPDELKINDSGKKIILRCAGKILGIHESVLERKKVAAQYGSNSDKVLKKISKGFAGKSAYLRSVYSPDNLRLGALYSGGKDSNLAVHIMNNQNYKVSCLITMLNREEYSYMFQKADKKIVELQSKALDIPVIFGKTKGIKEEELKDLKKLIKKARDEYCLDGIITGAIFSAYQRSRIFEICEELNLKIFSPLWHKSQEAEISELLKSGFEFIIVKVAALGLDDSWLGRIIEKNDAEKLIKLNKKWGVNVAGEGGEYETIVLNCPLFKKKIKITGASIVKEDENTAFYNIKKAELSEK